MSGQAAGTFIGFAVGSFFGPVGAQIGAMAGGYLGSSFDTYHTPGPRLGDIPVQTSAEGAYRPIPFGTPPPFFGNIIQAGPKIRVIVEEEVDNGKGGPTYTTDSEHVYQTFAIRISEGHEDLKLLKFWLDGKLAYDAFGGALEVDSVIAATKFTFYPGGEDQYPDPSLESLPVENGGGVGRTLAYRGTAYIVFDNFDLTPWGGRIPQVQFQVSTSATIVSNCPDDPIFWYPLDDALDGGVARELIVGAHGTYSGATAGPPLSLEGTGSAYFGDFGTYMVYENDSTLIPSFSDLDAWTVSCWCRPTDVDAGSSSKLVVQAATGDWVLGTSDWILGLGASEDLMQPFGAISYSTGFAKFNTDPTVRNVNANLYIAMTWVADSPSSTNGTRSLYVNGVLVSQSTGEEGRRSTRDASFILAGGGYAFPNSGQFLGYVADLKGYDYCLTQEDITNRYLGIDFDVWENPDAPGTYMRYDGQNVLPCGSTAETDTVTLESIATALVARVNVGDDEIDFSADADVEVRGFLAGGSQMTAQGALAPLDKAFFRDRPEFDLKVRSVVRGGATVATFTDDDFLESDDDQRFAQQQIELPRRLNVAYSDPDANYARRIQMAERESVNIASTGTMEVELPIVLTADEAAQKAEIFHKVTTEESLGTINRRLPAYKWAHLTVTDRFAYDDKEWRITKLDTLDAVIEIEAKRDRVSNYESAAVGGVALDPTAPVSSVKGPSILQALNLPRLTTAEQKPGMYLGVTGLTSAWPGADIYLSTDGGNTYVKRTTITKRATMGRLTADIAATADPFDLLIYNERTLASISVDQMAAGQNGLVITTDGASEIKQFQTAVLSAANTWTASDLNHGQLGTDDVAHLAADPWLLLDGAVVFLPIDAAHAGKTLYFRAVTRGTPIENNEIVTAVFDPQFTGPATVAFLQTISGDYAETIGGSRIEAISQ